MAAARLACQRRARACYSSPKSEGNHGIPPARPERPEGVAALPRHHDVRRRRRTRRRGAHHRHARARPGSTSSTPPTPTTTAGPRRSSGAAIAANRDALGPGDQGRQPDGRRARTSGGLSRAGSCRPPRPACGGSAPTTSTSTTCTRRTTRRRSRRRCARWATWCGPGKIRYFGVSNYRAWRVAEICRLCDELGIDRPVVEPALLQRAEPHAGGRAPAGLRRISASASCPTRRSPAAC